MRILHPTRHVGRCVGRASVVVVDFVPKPSTTNGCQLMTGCQKDWGNEGNGGAMEGATQ